MLFFSTPFELQDLLADVPISGLIASLLGAKDPMIVAYGMQAAEILMGKLPDVFATHFVKEGVAYAMDMLAAEVPPPASAEMSPTVGKLRRSSSRTKSPRGKGGLDVAAPAEPIPVPVTAQPAGAASISSAVPAGAELRAAAAARAQLFKATYFTDAAGRPVTCETEGIQQLRVLCEQLDAPEAVSKLLNMLSGTNGSSISTFEFLSSGAVQRLLQHLQGERDTHGVHSSSRPNLASLCVETLSPFMLCRPRPFRGQWHAAQCARASGHVRRQCADARQWQLTSDARSGEEAAGRSGIPRAIPSGAKHVISSVPVHLSPAPCPNR